jgi:methionyl aminopeptidase
MIYYKTDEEIELMRLSADLVSRTIAEVGKHIKPGAVLIDLDKVAEDFIRSHNAVPAFKGYKGTFPGTLCTSLNAEVVHGIPDKRALKEGDIISIDCGVVLNNYYGDSAFTFPVGEIKEELKQLLRVTRESLNRAVKEAKYGNRLGDIGFAVQDYCEKHGLSVVREMVGHGLGKKLHENPEVPNYGRRGSGPKLLPGLVIAIEPMINIGRKDITQSNDGWTIYATDQKPSAHFEHTVAITKAKTEVLTTFKYIDEALKGVLSPEYWALSPVS